MKIAQNCHFEIGSTHDICQDFAINGVLNFGTFLDVDLNYYFGIVCDGCSSSKHVDIGARILALAARKVIANLTHEKLVEFLTDDKAFELYRLIDAELHNSCIDDFIFSNNALDATLLVYLSDGVIARVYTYGDGVIIHRTPEKITIINLEYETNAPYYISYEFDGDRRNGYFSEYGNGKFIINKKIINIISREIEKDSNTECSFVHRASFLFDICEKSSLSIYSDGLNSFTTNSRLFDDNEKIDSCIRYSNYPIANGDVVIKNFKFNNKSNNKLGFAHMDDLSCAAIVKGVG